MLGLVLALGAKSRGSFDAWHNSDKWEVVGDAVLSPQNYRRLVGRPGTGVLVNGKEGKCPSLVTKRRDYRDVEVHIEFMVGDLSRQPRDPDTGQLWHQDAQCRPLRGRVSAC